jgi:hypothetical protein
MRASKYTDAFMLKHPSIKADEHQDALMQGCLGIEA